MAENLALSIVIGAGLGLVIGIASNRLSKALLSPLHLSYERIDHWVAAHPWLTAGLGAVGGVIAWVILRVIKKESSILQLGIMTASLAAGSFLRARWLARKTPTEFPEGQKSPW